MENELKLVGVNVTFVGSKTLPQFQIGFLGFADQTEKSHLEPML
jgi:hypothetical protein